MASSVQWAKLLLPLLLLMDVLGTSKVVLEPGKRVLDVNSPPPRRPKFRQVFRQLAGEDKEVSPYELMITLNTIISKRGNLKTDGFSIKSCRSMVAVMDSDSTGKLGFHEFKLGFKYLWNNIRKWLGTYTAFDADKSGTICSKEVPTAFKAAGFPLKDQLYQLVIRRYSDEHGDMDFDNFIGCMMRLDAMCLAPSV